MRRIFLFVLLPFMFLCLSCRKGDSPQRKLPPRTELSIFALQSLRSTGFEQVVLKDFATRQNTKLKLTLFANLPELLAALNAPQNKGQVDVVLGLDNSFALSDSLLDPFSPIPEVPLTELSFEVPKDATKRLIPYAYGYLALLSNPKLVAQPPQSWGELQDARYYSQLAMCDPLTDGMGRSTLLWSIALFGDSGFEQLWISLRKNVRKVYPDRWSALEALRKGECGLMLGWQSAGAWINELWPQEKSPEAIVPQEGSLQYVESAALCGLAPNRALAVDFLNYLISADAQKFVMYKLGLLPVNGRTQLISSFRAIPQNVYAHNQRLNQNLAAERMPVWLETWTRLNTRLPGL